MASLQLHRPPIDTSQRRHGDPRRHIDWVLLVTVGLLIVFGLVNIYAAKHRALETSGGDLLAYVKRQVLALVLGTVAMVTLMAIDYRRLRDWAMPLYMGSIGLLGAVLVAGARVNGARAWFDLGAFQLQPSELGKVVLVLVLAAYASGSRARLGLRDFVAGLVIAGLPAGLVLLQPDLGSAMVFGAIAMGVLLVAGARFKHIVAATLLGVAAVAFILGTHQLKDYQAARLSAFVQQEGDTGNQTADQVENAKVAIGSGGVSGQGYLNGSQTNGLRVYEPQTDFIFTVVAEQFGFAGAAATLLAYAVIVLRLWRTSQLSRDMLGTLICVGAISYIVFHVFENAGMNMGIMPVTGIPLPFLSYGGSSTIALLTMIGLVQSVHMRRFT